MIFNATDWTTVISVASGAAVTLSGVWVYIEKKFPQLAADVPSGIKHVIDTVASDIGGLAQTPWFASQAAAGKLEIRHVTDKLLQSHLGQAASQALASFSKSLGSMSQSEQGTAVEMVQSALKAIGQDVSPPVALAALQEADKVIATLSTVAQAATARSQALQPAPADTAPTQTS